MLPRRTASVLGLVLSLVACRAEPSASAPGHGEDTGTAPPNRSAASGGGVVAEDAPPDCGDGRVWDGKLTGCLYEHGGCCYDTPEAACRAAGCTNDRCRILESSPAQLYCA
jgi:hypothetical protein